MGGLSEEIQAAIDATIEAPGYWTDCKTCNGTGMIGDIDDYKDCEACGGKAVLRTDPLAEAKAVMQFITTARLAGARVGLTLADKRIHSAKHESDLHSNTMPPLSSEWTKEIYRGNGLAEALGLIRAIPDAELLKALETLK